MIPANFIPALALLRQSWQLAVPAGFVVGLVLGVVFFKTLHYGVDYLQNGQIAKAIASQILRFTVLALALWCLAGVGAIALISAVPGLLLARTMVLRGVAAP